MPLNLKLLDHLGDDPSIPWEERFKDHPGLNLRDVSLWMAKAWFEVHDVFHDGRLTSYMLRAFGYPNLLAYNEVKNGNAWVLDIGDGWGLCVRPFPFEASGYQAADHEDRQWMLAGLRAHQIFELIPLREPDRLANPALMKEIAQEFLRPVRFRDVLINASSLDVNNFLADLGERPAGTTANVLVDPRFRVSPEAPADVLITHPSRQTKSK